MSYSFGIQRQLPAKMMIDVAYVGTLGRHLAAQQNFNSIPGHGARATVNGKAVLVGNRKLLRDQGISFDGAQASADSLEGLRVLRHSTAHLMAAAVLVRRLLALSHLLLVFPERDGYRLSFLDIRRLVVTDLIRDYGVLFIWAAFLLFGAAACIWLPIRVFFPRREMMFRYGPGATKAYSRSEGARRRHAGVFHEALDLIDARKLDA